METSRSLPDLSLLSEGRSDSQIVVTDKLATPALTECLNQTARLLQTAFKANCAEVNVVTDSQRDAAKPAISLGNTVFAQQHGVDTAKLERWSYVQRVVGRDVILAGHDQPSPVPPER